MDTKSIVQQSKQNKLFKTYPEVKQIAEIIVSQMLEQILPELNSKVEQTLKDLQTRSLKGNKGEKPIAGIDYHIPKDGEDGKDYILTTQDKKEIASGIKVPVVEKVIEKTEIVKEKPVITNEIKEVAKYEKPLEIAKKLNTLEEKVDIKVIKGLNKWMQNIKSFASQKSSSGGMGNVQNESFSVNSTTTSVTLDSNVASGSSAILCFYQGQMMPKNESYSISGKTVTLLFTPEDGTYVDVWYVRA